MPRYPAQIRYTEKAIKRFSVDLNRNTEPDLIEWIESKPNKAGYVKELIRKDMEENKVR